MANDYLFAWASYLSAALVLLLVLRRLLGVISSVDVRTIILLLAFVLLFTPVPVASDSSFWSPAFMAALIDTVTLGPEAGLKRLWPILLSMLSILVLSLLVRILRAKPKADTAAS